MLIELGSLTRLNVMHEPGPTFETMLASEYKLGVGKYRIGSVVFVLAQAVDGGRIGVAQLLQQFFSLFAKLFERRAIGQTRR